MKFMSNARSAGLILGLVASPVTAATGAGNSFPAVFLQYARSLRCIPKIDQPFMWGVIKGGKPEDSAAFWCESKKDRGVPNIASIAIYVRPHSRLDFKCPKLIPFQNVGTLFRVWEAGVDGKASETLDQVNFLDTGRPGPKAVSANDYFLENVISDGSSGAHYYCYKNKWMKRGYH